VSNKSLSPLTLVVFIGYGGVVLTLSLPVSGLVTGGIVSYFT